MLLVVEKDSSTQSTIEEELMGSVYLLLVEAVALGLFAEAL